MDLPRLSENVPAPNIESNQPKNDQRSDNKIAEEVGSNQIKDIRPVKLARKDKTPSKNDQLSENKIAEEVGSNQIKDIRPVKLAKKAKTLPKNDQLSDNKIAEEVGSNQIKDIQPVKLAKRAKTLPKNDQLSNNKIVEVGSNQFKEIPPVKLAKKAKTLPTSHMVLEAIKSWKMRNGATVEAIRQEIERTHTVVEKSLNPALKRFLKTGVEKGLLDHVGGNGDKSRFKIKKNETFKKEKPNLKERKKLEAKKTGKKQVPNKR